MLPSNKITTVKHNEYGLLVWAKYRIVALENLDSHTWTKIEWFAPVCSLFELRFIIAMAAQHRRIHKKGDVAHTFCQSVLPDSKYNVFCLPAHCSITQSKTHWILKKTLYGMDIIPHHWYNAVRKISMNIWLKPCPNSQCMFKSSIIPGKPTL